MPTLAVSPRSRDGATGGCASAVSLSAPGLAAAAVVVTVIIALVEIVFVAAAVLLLREGGALCGGPRACPGGAEEQF